MCYSLYDSVCKILGCWELLGARPRVLVEQAQCHPEVSLYVLFRWMGEWDGLRRRGRDGRYGVGSPACG